MTEQIPEAGAGTADATAHSGLPAGRAGSPTARPGGDLAERFGADRAERFGVDLAARLARLLARHCAEGQTSWFWLDSPDGDGSSYLGFSGEVLTADASDPHRFLERLQPKPAQRDTAPLDVAQPVGGGSWQSGWLVCLSYEFGTALQRENLGLPKTPRPQRHPSFALRPATLVELACDGTVAVSGDDPRARELLTALLAEARQSAAAEPASAADSHPLSEPAAETTETTETAAAPDPLAAPEWSQSDDEYLKNIRSAQRAIANGDAYVLCLTNQARVRGEFDPLGCFLALRQIRAAHRGAVIVTPELALVSASPESFISVRKTPAGRVIATKPMKGTAPRDPHPETDRRHARELAQNPKERTENTMIVDLLRNDIATVAEPGSVTVADFLRVETHPHVHAMVSTVRGVLRQQVGLAELIAAVFPGGSMTGAPKLSAVEILASLEGVPRGIYSGCFGWIDDRGSLELAMTIRSVVLTGDISERGGSAGRAAQETPGGEGGARCFTLAELGAGGGITSDSIPERELAEMHLKAAPLLRALNAA